MKISFKFKLCLNNEKLIITLDQSIIGLLKSLTKYNVNMILN